MENKTHLSRMIITLVISILAAVIGATAIRGEGFSLADRGLEVTAIQNESIRCSGASQPKGLAQIGETEIADLQLNYQEEDGQSQVIHYPAASFLKVHFGSFHLLEGDYVTVSDPEGIEVYTYPQDFGDGNDGEAGFWAMSVMGDTVVLELHAQNDPYALGLSEDQLRQYGVAIDQYTRGYSQNLLYKVDGESDIQSICGKNDHKDVVCYSDSHSTEFEHSHAVARLLLNNGKNLCTGWRVGPRNDTMLTAEHCITSQRELDAAEIWFNYQNKNCGKNSLGKVTKIKGDSFLIDDYDLDFALFIVDDPEKIASFGYIQLDIREPELDEEICIPQHPQGYPKKFGIESDKNTDTVCRIDDAIMNGRAKDTDTGYYCDTEGGSSGSPVIARDSHKAIGLHHWGGCLNQGVRIDLIWPKIETYFEVVPQFERIFPMLYGEEYQPGKKYGPGMRLEWSHSAHPSTAFYEIQFSEDGGVNWQTHMSAREDQYNWANHHGDLPCEHGFFRCLIRNHSYFYRIRALDSEKRPISDWSNVVSAISSEWPARVVLATRADPGPYPSGAVVTLTLDLEKTYGKGLMLRWDMIAYTGATYKILGNTCQSGALQNPQAITCKLRIYKSSAENIIYSGGSTASGLLAPVPSIKVVVTGTDGLGDGFTSWDEVILYFRQIKDDSERSAEV